MFCKNIEPQIVLINKNNLRTFEPQECQKYKNVEPRQNLSGSYKKKCMWSVILKTDNEQHVALLSLKLVVYKINETRFGINI